MAPRSRTVVRPIRRSLRPYQRYLHAVRINGMSEEDVILQSLAIALANVSGWSADRIAFIVRTHGEGDCTVTNVDIHIAYLKWTEANEKAEVRPGLVDWNCDFMLREWGFEKGKLGSAEGTKLSDRLFPVHIEFAALWSPSKDSDLFPGFNAAFREENQARLAGISMHQWGGFSPKEKTLLASIPKLSIDHKNLMKKTIRSWYGVFRKTLDEGKSDRSLMPRLQRNMHKYRELKHDQHFPLIASALNIFLQCYEERWGTLDATPSLPDQNDNVPIESVGFGITLFMCMCMVDRYKAADCMRAVERQDLGFLTIGYGELGNDEHDKKCPVCTEMMVPEGDSEVPLQMIVCCGNVVGADCLRRWANSLVETRGPRAKVTCPLCRHHLCEKFLVKLFEGHEDKRVTQSVARNPSRLEIDYDADNGPESSESEADSEDELLMARLANRAVDPTMRPRSGARPVSPLYNPHAPAPSQQPIGTISTIGRNLPPATLRPAGYVAPQPGQPPISPFATANSHSNTFSAPRDMSPATYLNGYVNASTSMGVGGPYNTPMTMGSAPPQTPSLNPAIGGMSNYLSGTHPPWMASHTPAPVYVAPVYETPARFDSPEPIDQPQRTNTPQPIATPEPISSPTPFRTPSPEPAVIPMGGVPMERGNGSRAIPMYESASYIGMDLYVADPNHSQADSDVPSASFFTRPEPSPMTGDNDVDMGVGPAFS